MTSHNLRIWGMIQALIVRAMGFQAENRSRADRGLAPAYDEQAFADVSTDIERLANSFE